MRLILASASPRRAELLTAAGFTFETCAADVDERVIPGERPREYVRRLAQEKSAAALASRRRADHELIIGADTAVIVGDEILGKPANDGDAERMLRVLAGRAHVVMTGISVRAASGQMDDVVETVVYVRELSDAQVGWYVASGEGRDKAGAYAIQGLGSRFIPRIDGSYSNVVGLPVARVTELIERMT
jgi:septum formation protein